MPYLGAVPHYTAYIDEAGDEGIGKLAAGPVGGQSRWLILGACLVTRENDLKLPSWRDEIVAKFPLKKSRDLHFRDLKHEQKIAACKTLAQKPFHACLTMSHKVTLVGSRWESVFKQKNYLYNYLLRWLLERVTAFCNDSSDVKASSLRVVFSRRESTDYQSMADYLASIRDGREMVKPIRTINWKVFDVANISVENHSKWAGLQIADCISSAFYNALEPNVYGNYETGYARLLRSKLIKTNNSVVNSGFTIVPSAWNAALDAEQMAFVRSHLD